MKNINLKDIPQKGEITIGSVKIKDGNVVYPDYVWTNIKTNDDDGTIKIKNTETGEIYNRKFLSDDERKGYKKLSHYNISFKDGFAIIDYCEKYAYAVYSLLPPSDIARKVYIYDIQNDKIINENSFGQVTYINKEWFSVCTHEYSDNKVEYAGDAEWQENALYNIKNGKVFEGYYVERVLSDNFVDIKIQDGDHTYYQMFDINKFEFVGEKSHEPIRLETDNIIVPNRYIKDNMWSRYAYNKYEYKNKELYYRNEKENYISEFRYEDRLGLLQERPDLFGEIESDMQSLSLEETLEKSLMYVRQGLRQRAQKICDEIEKGNKTHEDFKEFALASDELIATIKEKINNLIREKQEKEAKQKKEIEERLEVRLAIDPEFAEEYNKRKQEKLEREVLSKNLLENIEKLM